MDKFDLMVSVFVTLTIIVLVVLATFGASQDSKFTTECAERDGTAIRSNGSLVCLKLERV